MGKYEKKEFKFALSSGIQELLNDFVESKEFSVKKFEILYKLAQELGVDAELLKKAGTGKVFRLMKNRISQWDIEYIQKEFVDRIDHFMKLDKQKSHMLLGKLLNAALQKKKFKYAKKILNLLLKTGYEKDNLLREMIVLYSYEINRYIKKKQIKKAYDLFLKLKKINPQEIIESYSFPRDSLYTAKLYSKFGNHEKAIQIYEVLFKKGTISEEKKKELMRFWQARGDKLLKQNDYFACYPLYKKVFEHSTVTSNVKPKIEEVVKKMITYYKKDNDMENMKKTYLEMLKLFKEDDKYKYEVYKDILYFEGDNLLHERLFSDAKKIFKDIVVKYPDFKLGKEKFIECEMLWAEDLYLQGEYTESSELLEKFSQQFPKEFKKMGIFVSLANAKSKIAKEKFYRGELFEAKKELLKALEFHSESKLAKGLLEKVDIAIAEDYVKENRFDVAIKLLKESLPELGGKSEAIKKRISEVLDKKSEYIITENTKMKKAEERVARLAALEKEKMLKRRSTEIAEEKIRKEKMDKYFFIFDDQYYDDRGPGSYQYPTNKIFKTGSFDIRKFEIINNSDTLTFNITIGNQIVKDVPSTSSTGSAEISQSDSEGSDRTTLNQFKVGSNGWVFQMFDIYIRYGEKGKHSKGLPGRNIIIENGWDKAIMVSPKGSAELHRDVRSLEDVLFSSYYSVKNDVFSFNISKSNFDSPPNHEWAYQLVSINYNPEYIENNFHVRSVQTSSSDIEFGGGTNYDGEPNVIDILDSDQHPQFISLSKYKSMPNPKDNKYAKIHLYKFGEIKDMFFNKE